VKKFPFDWAALERRLNNPTPAELAAQQAQYQAAYNSLFGNP
jgi:hypothetical protein